jgi:hypothetical protein
VAALMFEHASGAKESINLTRTLSRSVGANAETLPFDQNNGNIP